MSLSSNPAQRTGAFGSGQGILAGRLFGPQFGIVAIGVDAGASALLNRLSAQSRVAANEISKTSASLRIMGNTLASAVKLLAVAGVQVAGAAFIVSDFQQEVAQTAAIINTDVSVAFERLGKLSIDLSKRFAFSATEIQGAARQLGQAGQTLTEIEQTLEPVLQFVAATGAKMSDAVDLVVKTLNGFKLEASETQRVLDSLMFVINTSPTTVNDLQNAFKQLVPIAAQLGITLESTAAAVAAVSRAGLAGSTGGTSLASGLIQLLSPAKAVEDEFGNLILAFKQTLEQTGDLALAMDAFLRQAGTNIHEFQTTIQSLRDENGIKSFADISDETLTQLGTKFEVINILLDILGTRSAKGFLDYSVNAQQALTDTVALQLGLADTAASAEKTLETLSSQLTILRNRFTAPLLEGDFASTLTERLEAFAKSGVVDQLGEAFADLSEVGLDTIISLMETFITLVESATPVLAGFGHILDSMADLVNVVGIGFKLLGDEVSAVLVSGFIGFQLLKKVFGPIITEVGILRERFSELRNEKFAIQGATQLFNASEVEHIANLKLELGLEEQKLNVARAQLEILKIENALRRESNLLRINKIDSQLAVPVGAVSSTGQRQTPQNVKKLNLEKSKLNQEVRIGALREKQYSAALLQSELRVDAKRDAIKDLTKGQKGSIKESKRLSAAQLKAAGATQVHTGAIIQNTGALIANHAISALSLIQMFVIFKIITSISEGNVALTATLVGVSAAIVALNAVLAAYTARTSAAAAATIALKIAQNPLIAAAIVAGLAAAAIGLAVYFKHTKKAAEETSKFSDSVQQLERDLQFFKTIENDLKRIPGSFERLNELSTFDPITGERQDVFQLTVTIEPPTPDNVRVLTTTLRNINTKLSEEEQFDLSLFSEESLSSAEGQLAAIEALVDSSLSDEDILRLAEEVGGDYGKSLAKGLIQGFEVEYSGEELTEIVSQENLGLIGLGGAAGKAFGRRFISEALKEVGPLALDLTKEQRAQGAGLIALFDAIIEDKVVTKEELVQFESALADVSPEVRERFLGLLNDFSVDLTNVVFETGELTVDTFQLVRTEFIANIMSFTNSVNTIRENVDGIADATEFLTEKLNGFSIVNGQVISTMDRLDAAGVDATGAMEELAAISEKLKIINTIAALTSAFEAFGQEAPGALIEIQQILFAGLLEDTANLTTALTGQATTINDITNGQFNAAQDYIDSLNQVALENKKLAVQTARQRVEEARKRSREESPDLVERQLGIRESPAVTQELLTAEEELAAAEQALIDYEQSVSEGTRAQDRANKIVNALADSQSFSDLQEKYDGLGEVLSSLQEATTQTVNGVTVATSAFHEMEAAGFDVAGALEIFKEFTLRNQMLNIVNNIINTLQSIGSDVSDNFLSLQTSLLNSLIGLGDQFGSVFNAETFNPETIIEIWAKALDSPRFEQNNNIVVRISGDEALDPQRAAELADAIIVEINNRQRLQSEG